MGAHGVTRVLVAGGQPLLRLGIRGELEDAGFVVCAEAGSARAAVAAALGREPDLCILDCDLPGDGLEAAREIASRLPETAIVMLSENPDDPEVLAALEAGAAGCVPKDIDPLRLPDVATAALAGEPVAPRRVVRRLLERIGLGR
jgi:DNA-binding NarL/FixJ family response regulator